MRNFIALAFAALFPAFAAAQENTVEDWSWIVDHYQQDGQWISACDHRDDNGVELKRCYLSLVDVFSPRPQFGAAFVFVTSTGRDQLKFEFRFEPGSVFAKEGFRVVTDNGPVWTYDTARCPDLKCFIDGSEAGQLASLLSGPGTLMIDLTDRYGQHVNLQWQNTGFAAMLSDFRSASAQRRL